MIPFQFKRQSSVIEVLFLKLKLKYNKDIISDFKDNPKIGTNGIYTKYTRLTFVCYLREKLINCDKNNINEKLISKN